MNNRVLFGGGGVACCAIALNATTADIRPTLNELARMFSLRSPCIRYGY